MRIHGRAEIPVPLCGRGFQRDGLSTRGSCCKEDASEKDNCRKHISLAPHNRLRLDSPVLGVMAVALRAIRDINCPNAKSRPAAVADTGCQPLLYSGRSSRRFTVRYASPPTRRPNEVLGRLDRSIQDMGSQCRQYSARVGGHTYSDSSDAQPHSYWLRQWLACVEAGRTGNSNDRRYWRRGHGTHADHPLPCSMARGDFLALDLSPGSISSSAWKRYRTLPTRKHSPTRSLLWPRRGAIWS